MKLNNVIILNRRHMRDFFSFTEFWKKRGEFKDVANSELFFKPKDCDLHKNQLKAQVVGWINGKCLTDDKRLENSCIILPSCKIPRLNTRQCDKELGRLSREEAFGVVCLYEMMERSLKTDIYEILSCLGHDVVNIESGIVIVKNDTETTFERSDAPVAHEPGRRLQNVLIANLSNNSHGTAKVKWGDESVELHDGECLRALFYGNRCLKFLGSGSRKMRLTLDRETLRTGLCLNGVKVYTAGNVLDVACGLHGGYVYATDMPGCKYVSRHKNFPDEDYYLVNSIGKDERVCHMELNENETKCLLLTDKLRLYMLDANNDDDIVLVDENVVMASFDKNKLSTLKTIEQ